ncbi:MAG: hydrogenase [Lentisphaerae bacterium RIFOXYC12_FULL_60_16]|nr:MAG: hydrogenase [Lentisphaerae bacterium RIFOXYC12_FULL_60_16]OGV86250.1 MAG: hydrogenase [Lentisphaerae bacterium RIFOXYB12_FULL_60_10]
MKPSGFVPFVHGDAVPRRKVPILEIAEFRKALLDAIQGGQRLVSWSGHEAGDGSVELLAVLADDVNGTLAAAVTRVRDGYPSVTPECPQAHWFEREIAEQWAIKPEGHPWLKPIRFHAPYRAGASMPGGEGSPLPGVTDYFHMEGDEVHEVAVGPVHAGVIEPGHFRFQCHGETVFHLEIELGYQHRGLERHLRGGPDRKTVHYLETAAGDTTIGHATAYAHLVEQLASVRVPSRAQVLRGVALELERLANHTGDLGALAGDVGYLPTASYCGRIRGDWLNLTAVLCGNRFGRGLVRPGGLGVTVDAAAIAEVQKRLDALEKDLTSAVELLWSTNSVMARFEETGCVSRQDAEMIGLVGPAARASGIARDIRNDFPSGIYRYAHIPVGAWHSGDVFARAFIRWTECQRSIAFIREQLSMLGEGAVQVACGLLAPDTLAVSLVEGWRGEICHVALTDPAGRFAHYKVVDPSFHNWFGLALSLRNQAISDFPLCNKSFNLSYCGHDL